MWEILAFIDCELMRIHEEIRTTNDRLRLMELGVLRAYLKLKETQVLDELDEQFREANQ